MSRSSATRRPSSDSRTTTRSASSRTGRSSPSPTDQIVYGSRNWRDRPKALLHAAPAGDFQVHWVDEDYGAGTHVRHLLLDFGGGAWRTDRVGLRAMKQDTAKKHNVEPFFAELGDRAHQIQ